MHPSELKNRAIVAAAKAEMDGFTATAEAFILLAKAFASEARDLDTQKFSVSIRSDSDTTLGRVRRLEGIH